MASHHKRRVMGTMALTALAEVFNKAFPLITVHYAQSRLGLEALGYAHYVIYLVDLIVPFVAWGYQGFGSHAVSATKDPVRVRQIMGSILALRLFNGFVLSALLLAAVWTVPQWQEYRSGVLALCALPLLNAFSQSYLFVGKQLLRVLSVIQISAKIFALCAILLLVSGPEDALMYAAAAYSVNGLISVVGAFLQMRWFGLPQFHLASISHTFRAALPFTAPVVMFHLSERVDLFLVEWLEGSTGVGAYTGPQKITQSLSAFAMAIVTVFQSEVLAASAPQRRVEIIRWAYFSLLILFLPLVCCVWFVDEKLLTAVVGESFAGQGRVWSVLTLSLLAQPLLLVSTQIVLFSEKRMASVSFCYLAVALLSAGCGAAVGAWGDSLEHLAAGLVAGKAAAALVVAAFAYRVVPSLPRVADWGMVLVATFCAVGFLWSGLFEEWVILRVFAAVMVYVIILAVLARDRIRAMWKLALGR